MRILGTVLLVGIASVHASDLTEAKKRIAPWSSAVKCLAPLAREARSGEKPLELQQAFFDGPFRFPGIPESLPGWVRGIDGISNSEHDRLLSKGYELALFFDDREAERCFRACLELEPQRPEGYLGLGAVNTSDPRRFRCFLEAARERVGEESFHQRWVEILGGHPVISEMSPDEWSDTVRLQLRADPHPFHVIVLLRSMALLSLSEGAIADETEVSGLASEFPGLPIGHFAAAADPSRSELSASVARSPLALRMIADGVAEEGRSADAFQLRNGSIREELARLDRIGNVMPEATLALGSALASQLRSLSVNDPEGAVDLARRAMEWPRDVHSVGKRWRNLQRDETLWVVARRFLAEHLLRTAGADGLEGISRGFLPADKCEWFAWKAIGEIVGGGSFNPWLAALRKEPGSDQLVEAVEAYIAWKDGESDGPPGRVPGLPPEWFGGGAQQAEPGLSADVRIPGLAPRVRTAPGFSLPDGTGEQRSLRDFLGRPVVVIFFLGGGCLHCVEQLTAFGPWADRFSRAGIDLLAVSTDKAEYLSETLSQEDRPSEAFPIPIVSDSELAVFREWGVVDEFDDRALHGTFLVSPEGGIVWEETGNAPYMHPDFLLWEASRLLDR